MSSASVEDHRTNLELKDVGTPETSFCRALADLKKFTCEQVELANAPACAAKSLISRLVHSCRGNSAKLI